jgi:predicted MPP superfamily phosphohydrolase
MSLATLIFRIGILFALIILIDIYTYQGVKFLTSGISSLKWRSGIRIGYWVITIGFLALATSIFFVPSAKDGPSSKLVTTTFGFFVMAYLPKFVFLTFLMLDDLQILVRFAGIRLSEFWGSGVSEGVTYKGMSRSDFILKAGVLVASIPFASVAYGILKGRYDYKVRRIKVPIQNLPKDLEGFTITQISDIHSGSLDDRDAVLKGIELANAQKSDVICFTGDLVNNKAVEVEPLLDVFSRLSAPLGVYSVLGNHDYGDYVRDWKPGEKSKNFQHLLNLQKQMGWQLLKNEHVLLTKGTSRLAIIGIENWGAKGGFARYGKMQDAVEGLMEASPSVKVLLSHDPSHWDAEVRTKYSDIDLTLSGHTHGFQFGVEIPGFHWSPVQYVYKQWAGLYSQGLQHLYVNRGFGFIGFPGRVGILPEISVLELVSKA